MPDQTQGFSAAGANVPQNRMRGEFSCESPALKLSYANVIATIALFVALGGAAIAAGLPKNSVGTNQLKRGAVSAAKLKRAAVTSGKIAPKAVTAGKLGANAVMPGNLGNGIITTNKISDGAVIAAKIKNGVVTTNKLNNGAVTDGEAGRRLGHARQARRQRAAAARNAKERSDVAGSVRHGGGGIKTEPGDEAHGAISYQFPLAGSPTATVLQMDQTSGDCAGLGGGGNQTPQATAGHLCIYITADGNVTRLRPSPFDNDTSAGLGLALKAN